MIRSCRRIMVAAMHLKTNLCTRAFAATVACLPSAFGSNPGHAQGSALPPCAGSTKQFNAEKIASQRMPASPKGTTATEWTLEGFIAYEVQGGGSAVTIGDVTGDDLADVVLAIENGSQEPSAYQVLVYPQTASGELGTPVASVFGHPASVGEVSIGVLRLDDQAGDDVAIGTPEGLIPMLAGPGGVLQALPMVTDPSIRAMTAVDLNGDGLVDLASTTWRQGGHIMVNSGDGSFSISPWPVITNGYNSIGKGDLDGDGDLDVVTGSDQGLHSHVRVHRNDGDGTLTEVAVLEAQCPTSSSGGAQGVDIGDLNGDGRADIAASSGGNVPGACVIVYYAQEADGFMAPTFFDSFHIPGALRVVDINADGRLDVVVLHVGWYQLGVYLQQDDASLGAERLFLVPFTSNDSSDVLEVGQVLGDQCPDVALAVTDAQGGLATLEGSFCIRFFTSGFE